MGGAYTAKPDASTAPVVPDSWNLEWPFPGVAPPGYEHVYAAALSAPSSMAPGTYVHPITLKLTDHTDYPTTSPEQLLVWSATLSSTGEAVGLKSSAFAEYDTTMVEWYYDIGESFYGSTPSFFFDVSGANVGDSIILEAKGDPFGTGDVNGRIAIEISAEPPEDPAENVVTIKVVFDATITIYLTPGSEPDVVIGGYTLNINEGFGRVEYEWSGDFDVPTQMSSSTFPSGGGDYSASYPSPAFFASCLKANLGWAFLTYTVTNPESSFEIGYTIRDPICLNDGTTGTVFVNYSVTIRKGSSVISSSNGEYEKRLNTDDEYFPLGTVNGTTGVIT
jgi:hypothetical protein